MAYAAVAYSCCKFQRKMYATAMEVSDVKSKKF